MNLRCRLILGSSRSSLASTTNEKEPQPFGWTFRAARSASRPSPGDAAGSEATRHNPEIPQLQADAIACERHLIQCRGIHMQLKKALAAAAAVMITVGTMGIGAADAATMKPSHPMLACKAGFVPHLVRVKVHGKWHK